MITENLPRLLTADGDVGTYALRTSILDHEADLPRLAEAWDQLSGGVPFRSWAWNECWWRHYHGPQDRIQVLVLEDRSGNIRGVAPWYLGRSPWLGRVVRFLGTGEVCSEQLSILCEPGWQAPVVDALANWLTHTDQLNWDTLELDGVDAENGPVQALVAALIERRHRVHCQHSINAWRVRLPGTWEEYLAAFAGKRREKVRRAFRRKFDTGQARLVGVHDEASLAEGWPIFESLHNRRRESQGKSGCFASRRFTAFHREIAPRLLASGNLRLQWLELQGQPAAAEYGLCDRQTAYCYQTGFEPGLAEESPGWLAIGASIHLAIEQGYRSYDFLRGDERYKASWQAQPRALSMIRVFARHWRGSAQHGAWSLGQRAKRGWRQFWNSEPGDPPAANEAQSKGSGGD